MAWAPSLRANEVSQIMAGTVMRHMGEKPMMRERPSLRANEMPQLMAGTAMRHMGETPMLP